MQNKILLFMLFLAFGTPPLNAADSWDAFIGTWEYRQSNPGSSNGFDDEGERIEIVRAGGSVVVRYFGLERMGEDGLYYSATKVKKQRLGGDGRLSFIVPERYLFEKRPVNIEQTKMKKNVGISRYELTMQGQIVKGRLELSCSSESGECPEERMIFRKAPWN